MCPSLLRRPVGPEQSTALCFTSDEEKSVAETLLDSAIDAVSGKTSNSSGSSAKDDEDDEDDEAEEAEEAEAGNSAAGSRSRSRGARRCVMSNPRLPSSIDRSID